MYRFTLELLNKETEKCVADGLKNIKSMYPNAKVNVIKNTKSTTTYEVIDNVRH